MVSSHNMRRLQSTPKGGFSRATIPAGVAVGTRLSVVEFRALLEASPPERKRQSPEEDLQIECADWLKERAVLTPWPLRRMFHTPNGGGRSKAEAGRLKAAGVQRGVPDWLCPIPWKGWTGLAIEMKSAEGRLSDGQSEWLSDLADAGYLTGVARSLDAFTALVERYLDGRRDRPA